MGLNYVLDTNVVLYWLADELLDPLPNGKLYISVITEIEVLSFPFADKQAELGAAAFLATMEIVPITQAIKQKTIDLRRTRTVKLPDSLIAATTIAIGGELITNDLRMIKLPGLTSSKLRMKGSI